MAASDRNSYGVPVWSTIAGRIEARRKVRVVAAARSEGLARVLGHVLLEADEFESFIGVPSPAALVAEVCRLSPDVIVVALPSLGSEPAARIGELKAAFPASRLLVIASAEEMEASRPRGADAQIPEEEVVASLVSDIRRLARSLIGGWAKR
jgi:hypothetical protein